MEKAFDLKDLGNRLLAGLKVQAVPATDATLSWVAESCALVESAIVKGVGAVVVAVKPSILAEVAKAVAGPALARAAHLEDVVIKKA